MKRTKAALDGLCTGAGAALLLSALYMLFRFSFSGAASRALGPEELKQIASSGLALAAPLLGTAWAIAAAVLRNRSTQPIAFHLSMLSVTWVAFASFFLVLASSWNLPHAIMETSLFVAFGSPAIVASSEACRRSMTARPDRIWMWRSLSAGLGLLLQAIVWVAVRNR